MDKPAILSNPEAFVVVPDSIFAHSASICTHLQMETEIGQYVTQNWVGAYDTMEAYHRATIEAAGRICPTALSDIAAYCAELEAERDEARQIVRDTYWMALRYADGRQSYAVGMANDAVRKGYDAGWLVHSHHSDPLFARDGRRTDYASATDRALKAEARIAELEARLAEAERVIEPFAKSFDHKLGTYSRFSLGTADFEAATDWMKDSK